MERRPLGKSGLNVSRMGLGCMGMSEFYGPADEAESRGTLELAVDRGLSFLDTADFYGDGKNEELLADILGRRREEIVLATKFGIMRDPAAPQDATRRKLNGRPEYVRSACEASLRRLGVDVIDLYYLHRMDPSTPIEETVGAMAELVKEGKVRALGLSETPADIIRRAAKVHPIAALQSEYSLWTRDPEDGPLQACRELGITLVPYSPLGRGFLTGQIRTPADFGEDDFRRNNPRFQGENFRRNLELVEKVSALAKQKGASAGQLALAWVMAQGEDVVPIPGTKKRKNLEENLGALEVRLTAADLAGIEAVFPRSAVSGARYATGTVGAQSQATGRRPS
ncbi:MAG TPA: aldo/keto reductase [Myxococcaceae bacterium]|jgi:aryl-alcohol dehydrogenase-like predicted oxidoreductase